MNKITDYLMRGMKTFTRPKWLVTAGAVGLLLVYFQHAIHGQDWSVAFDGVNTFSSPRVADLNGDGVGDVILGAGREEFHACDSSVFALDGTTGALLWTVTADDQIFGSANLKDLNGDGVSDVLIGGRSAELIAINGVNGEVFWRFDKTTDGMKWYNFYNPQFIRDQNGDGQEDILVSNGGDVMAAPYDPKRPAGHLVVLSGKDGSLIAKAPMPDGKETYMSVAALPVADGNDYQIIFGTGGETIGGSLYVTTLSAVLSGSLADAKQLDTSYGNGYIGPPLWVDINADGHHDIVANAVEGKLVAFDGRTHARLWSLKVPNTEAYSSVAPGYFSGSSTPDFFVSYAIGTWPDLEWGKQLMVKGDNGAIAFVDSLGFYQTSTPVVIDLNHDGRDEALLSVNLHAYDDQNNRTLHNMLMLVDFATSEVTPVTDSREGSNISSTPWIGDIDGDGRLDIVYCHGTNTEKSYIFDGMRINRVSTSIRVKDGIRWNGYMGDKYDGIFPVGSGVVGGLKK